MKKSTKNIIWSITILVCVWMICWAIIYASANMSELVIDVSMDNNSLEAFKLAYNCSN